MNVWTVVGLGRNLLGFVRLLLFSVRVFHVSSRCLGPWSLGLQGFRSSSHLKQQQHI